MIVQDSSGRIVLVSADELERAGREREAADAEEARLLAETGEDWFTRRFRRWFEEEK